MERELEDLKRKQYEQQQELERNVNSSKNRLSMVPNNGILGGSVMGSTNNTMMGTQTVSYKYPTPPQNLSNSQEQDTSTEHKQKKKYKVTITTSHEVNVD